MAVTIGISLLTTRLILNSLGVSDFGVFGIVAGLIGMLSFLDGAMATATQRFMSYAEGKGDITKKNKIFNVSLLLHIIIACIVVVMLEAASYIFFGGLLNIAAERMYSAKCIYHFMVISTAFTIITVPYDASINAHENMLFYSVSGIAESFLKLGAAIWVVYTLRDKLILYGLLMSVITIIILIIKQIYCYVKYEECKVNLKKYYDKAVFREITKFAGWNFISSMGMLLGNYGSGLVVNHFFGTKVNAAQSITGQLNGQLLAFSSNMLKALNPAIIKKEGGGDRASMLKLSLTGCKLAYILLAVFAIPFLVETEYILRLWLKVVPEWTVIFVRLFLITTLIQQLTITLNTTISAIGNIKGISLFNSLLCLLPNGIYILIFSFGASPVWLYILILVNLGIINGVYVVYQCKKHFGLNVSEFVTKIILPNFLVTIILIFAARLIVLFQAESPFRLIEVVLFCAISFLILAFQFSFNKEEKQIIRNISSKLLSKINLT